MKFTYHIRKLLDKKGIKWTFEISLEKNRDAIYFVNFSNKIDDTNCVGNIMMFRHKRLLDISPDYKNI